MLYQHRSGNLIITNKHKQKIEFCSNMSIVNRGNSIMVFRDQEYKPKEGFKISYANGFEHMELKVDFKPNQDINETQFNRAIVDYSCVDACSKMD